MKEFKGQKTAAEYIEMVYGTRRFARTVDINDASSLMDLMQDFSDHNSAELLRQRNEMLQKLQSILYMSEDKGVMGCTWGDTDMSSTDVAFGYNLALEYAKKGIEELIKEVES